MRGILILTLLYAAPAFACDFSTGIQRQDYGFLYSNDCHREVGRIINELDERKKQKELYEQLLETKDQRIELEKQRTENYKQQAELWKSTAKDIQDRADTITNLSESNKWLYIGAGVLLTVAAGFAIGATGGAAAALVIL